MLLRHEARHCTIALSYAKSFFSVAARRFVLWYWLRANQVVWCELASLLLLSSKWLQPVMVSNIHNRPETSPKKDAGRWHALATCSQHLTRGRRPGSSLDRGTRRVYISFSASHSPRCLREELDRAIFLKSEILLGYWYARINNKHY